MNARMKKNIAELKAAYPQIWGPVYAEAKRLLPDHPEWMVEEHTHNVIKEGVRFVQAEKKLGTQSAKLLLNEGAFA